MQSPLRPDGIAKLKGEFEYAQDLESEGMLWGATVRSPHASALIESIDIAPALAIGGVHAVLTASDVPGRPTFGLEHPDQPVLAGDTVRFWGEPVAIVAAEDPDTARMAAAAVDVTYQEQVPLVDPAEADLRDEVFRRMRVRRGDQEVTGPVVVEGYYEVGMQDQAPWGRKPGSPSPTARAGSTSTPPASMSTSTMSRSWPVLACPPKPSGRIPPGSVGLSEPGRTSISTSISACSPSTPIAR